MRGRIGASAAGFLLFALWSTGVSADPIIWWQDRFVGAEALVFGSSGSLPAMIADSQEKGDNLAASVQTSRGDTTIAADAHLVSTLPANLNRLSGVGRTSAASAGPGGHARSMSIFEVLFEIDEPHVYDFSGTFATFGSGSWQTQLIHPSAAFGPSLLFMAFSNPDAEQQLRFRGALDPGRYALLVRADASAGTILGSPPFAASTFDFMYDMSPVPEPGSLMLVGTGALALVARARRRTRRS